MKIHHYLSEQQQAGMWDLTDNRRKKMKKRGKKRKGKK